jgi:hypothetical protein
MCRAGVGQDCRSATICKRHGDPTIAAPGSPSHQLTRRGRPDCPRAAAARAAGARERRARGGQGRAVPGARRLIKQKLGRATRRISCPDTRKVAAAPRSRHPAAMAEAPEAPGAPQVIQTLHVGRCSAVYRVSDAAGARGATGGAAHGAPGRGGAAAVRPAASVVKVYDKSRMQRRHFLNVAREAALLARLGALRVPGVVRLAGTYESDAAICLWFEAAAGGDLHARARRGGLRGERQLVREVRRAAGRGGVGVDARARARGARSRAPARAKARGARAPALRRARPADPRPAASPPPRSSPRCCACWRTSTRSASCTATSSERGRGSPGRAAGRPSAPRAVQGPPNPSPRRGSGRKRLQQGPLTPCPLSCCRPRPLPTPKARKHLL